MTGAETTKLMAVLKAAFPRQELGSETVKLYCEMLADFTFTEAVAAVKGIIATSNFFPTIAEIRSRVVEHRERLPSAEEAWAEVARAIQDFGSYRKPAFSCELVARAVDAIGWQTLCMSENISVDRAHYMRCFESMKSRHLASENTTPLLEKPPKQTPLELPSRREPYVCPEVSEPTPIGKALARTLIARSDEERK